MEDKKLVKEALAAREKAYAPYSNFSVGAAVLMENNKVFRGANIENAAFSSTCCGERVAIFNALSNEKNKIKKIAVLGGPVGGKPKKYIFPCGTCRQVIAEFADPNDCEILVAISEDEIKKYTLQELLPHSFDEEDLL